MMRASSSDVLGIGILKPIHLVTALLVLAGPSLVVAGCTPSMRRAADAPPAEAYQTPAITLATITRAPGSNVTPKEPANERIFCPGVSG